MGPGGRGNADSPDARSTQWRGTASVARPPDTTDPLPARRPGGDLWCGSGLGDGELHQGLRVGGAEAHSHDRADGDAIAGEVGVLADGDLDVLPNNGEHARRVDAPTTGSLRINYRNHKSSPHILVGILGGSECHSDGISYRDGNKGTRGG